LISRWVDISDGIEDECYAQKMDLGEDGEDGELTN
jgi:hypothetical protein